MTDELTFPLSLKEKYVALLAPSFVVDFNYPQIISALRQLGFYKVVELTFGAKMVNSEYHKIFGKTKGFGIASVCPGVVETVKGKLPRYQRNLMPVDSPMIAMAKICKKTYPGCKTVFISPCNFKKAEAANSGVVDYAIDYKELAEIIKTRGIRAKSKKERFDRFYNDYTKIYPVAGGLSKTAHLSDVLKPSETKVIDGIQDVINFLENPDKSIRFLDANFCKGGCIGGPCVNSKLPLLLRKKKVINYLKRARKEDIPESKKGLVSKAKGICFLANLNK
jgi:iron only hydrogenase large subunit-like protein